MTTQSLSDAETAFHNWATEQPWWQIIGPAGRLEARAIVHVPAFPEALRAHFYREESGGSLMYVAMLRHRGTGATTMVVEDPMVTSWYVTISAKDCDLVNATGQYTTTPVGEA